MTKKLDILLYAGLFSGLGVFSYLLLVSYSGFSPLVQEELYSFGACLFCILAFNILGYFTMRISSWLNVSYALNIRRRWRIVVIYLLVMLMFFLLNYGLLVSAKLLAGASFYFLCRGKVRTGSRLVGGISYLGVVAGFQGYTRDVAVTATYCGFAGRE